MTLTFMIPRPVETGRICLTMPSEMQMTAQG